MSETFKHLRESMMDWLSMLAVSARAIVASPLLDEEAVAAGEQYIDPDFNGWLHGDPFVTKNPASRYGDRAPGYLTGNGLGSLEVGAADD